MRQKRAKTYRKLMSLYSLSFGFRQPYQVLVDSEMCKESVAHKIDLVKQLGAVLQGTVKPMITQCCIHELYLQGKEQQPAVDLAKTFERRKCNHREAIPGEDCVASVVGDVNKHCYVIATQSQVLRNKLRNIPAVPIVHINRSVMILEPPSKATLDAKGSAEERALHPSAPELAKLPSTAAAEPPKKKKKGPKGPNPLSVKKKKAKVDQPTSKEKKSSKDEHVRVGEKRRRDEDTEEPKTPATEGSGHKRKRRRKTHNSTTPAAAAADVGDDS
ncbi:Fcf1-domain-containing protein [Wolfiporia cocos MD-104 SS10]|uniref:U three protein 23 n=1 Tax=Wolfiporia cocos (strain MD-104) TaxID=742152 RepID=A0A2H3IV29_WOLCO|nr:Fcf1-domain-containing protein [Wolfiporia cocos MD-104 SS10]